MNYKRIEIDGLSIFYREAGPATAPTIVLLHGFPSSSHMFRDLIPLLADEYHVIAPDYPGFGYSDAPAVGDFDYTFDNLASIVDRLLTRLGLERYSLYMQDYGGPVGLRIAAAHPERIVALVFQNANAYEEGISDAFKPLRPFWEHRTAETEEAARTLLTRETTIFQYLHGARNTENVSPDAWTFDQSLLDRPGNNAIQLELLHNYPTNVALYPAWQQYFREHQPPTLVVSGANDPFFLPAGQRAFARDLPAAEVHLLDTGHFALEEDAPAISGHIRRFMADKVAKLSRSRR